MIALASLAGQWNDVLPSHLTFANYARALAGDTAEALRVSMITGLLASALALVSGTWAALALRNVTAVSQRVLGALFFIPSAVPSVSVGLGLLVAFSRPPVLLNGTIAIVVIAHLVLVSAFTFGNVTAGLSRLPADFEQVAASLGFRLGDRAGAVWQADRAFVDLPAALSIAAREASGRTDGRSLRVHLVTATIARISQDCAARFQVFADVVRNRVAAAPIKHMDETGFRIGGKTQWLHIASTMLLTFYRVSARRGSLLAHVTGIVVHDHWKPYYTLKAACTRCVTHTICVS